ncbi:MAG: hypothetical protein PHI12_07725 [Dehalococcoidales bacterium]|nr:hypothetical protein [Dehalococcoidales bacterium]
MPTLADRLQDDESTPVKGERKPASISSLEREMALDDDALATDLRRTRAEELIAIRRKRIEQLTGNSGQGAEVSARRETNVEQSLVDVAQGLLDKGMEPNTVGRMVDYLIGSRQPVGAYGFPGAPAPAGQQITLTDMLNFADRLNKQPQTDPAIASLLDKLTTEITEIKAKVAGGFKPTGAIMVQQADGTFLKVADSDQTVVIPRATPPPTGISLEEKRLDIQHEEFKAKLDADKERSTAIVNTLAAIPEKIGEGLAALAEARSNTPAARTVNKPGQNPQNLPVWRCTTEGCGTDIPVPPGAQKIVCPKCKTEYKGSE